MHEHPLVRPHHEEDAVRVRPCAILRPSGLRFCRAYCLLVLSIAFICNSNDTHAKKIALIVKPRFKACRAIRARGKQGVCPIYCTRIRKMRRDKACGSTLLDVATAKSHGTWVPIRPHEAKYGTTHILRQVSYGIDVIWYVDVSDHPALHKRHSHPPHAPLQTHDANERQYGQHQQHQHSTQEQCPRHNRMQFQ